MFDLYADIAIRLPINQLFTYRVPQDMHEKILPGIRVMINFNGREEEGMVTKLHSLEPDYETRTIMHQVDPEPVVNEYQIELAKWMADTYLAGIGECLFKMFPPGKKHPVKNKFVTHELGDPRFVLNEEQQEIYDSSMFEMENPEHLRVKLLHGITGSGKTEIYIHLIYAALQKNRSSILLVPEIALTIQLIERLKEVFTDNLALMHSGMKGKDRFQSYMSVLRDEKKIVVGTRSAIFAPLKNPGVIIIDEEHDSSYREHSSPRYDARAVALKRSQDHRALLLLGSATPRVETYYKAKKEDNRTISYHRLTRRATGASLPDVEIIPIDDFNKPISGRALEEINENVRRGEQSIILLNRRGYAPFQYCRQCESSLTCPNCSVGLNYHVDGKLVCHYCGYSRKNDGICDRCGTKTSMMGTGTQKLEEYLLKLYPALRLERLDTDAAMESSNVGECIGRLLSGDIDILLGTQMIAKGLDAPNVTLVGVLQADYGLNLPDFRAQERTFSLLTQVAGRSGRGDKKGRVFFEAMNPDSAVLRHAARQDYESFFAEEIRYRYEAWYPPFCRIVRILFRSENETDAQNECGNFSKIVTGMLDQTKKDSHTRLYGPVSAPINKIHNKYRYHVLLKTVKPRYLHEILGNIIPEFKNKMKDTVYMEIEFDAVDLL